MRGFTKRRRGRFYGGWAAAIMLALVTTVGSDKAAAEIKVVVTSKPVHALVAAVMSGAGTPRLLVDGNASPHTYALKPSDAKALNEADVVFRVSEGLEPFTAKVLKTLPKTVRFVTLAEAPGLIHLERRQGGAFEAHSHGKSKRHAHGHDEHDNRHDPHVWLDPANAKALTTHITNVLNEVAPTDAATFKANAAELLGRLDALASELQIELKPVAATPFIVFHDSLQYLEARFGLSTVGAITVNPDEQPSAKRLVELRKKVATLGAVCVLSEPQFPTKLVTSLTEGSTARTAVIDPEGGLLRPGPDLYFELMRKAAASLKSCLQ